MKRETKRSTDALKRTLDRARSADGSRKLQERMQEGEVVGVVVVGRESVVREMVWRVRGINKNRGVWGLAHGYRRDSGGDAEHDG